MEPMNPVSRFQALIALVLLYPCAAAAQGSVPIEALRTAIDTIHIQTFGSDLVGENSDRALHLDWLDIERFGGEQGKIPTSVFTELSATEMAWEDSRVCGVSPSSCRMPTVPIIFKIGYRSEASGAVTVRLHTRFRTRSERSPVAQRIVDVTLHPSGTGWQVTRIQTIGRT